MRRLLFALGLSAVALSACRDSEAPTEPSAPTPDALTASCRPVLFPLVRVSALIVKVFPAGKLRVEAVARAGIIAALWDTCKRAPAQKAAIAFIDFMNANSARLIGTQEQRNQLINLILNGVGIPGSVPPTGSADFGVGFFDPTSNVPLVVKTTSKVALTEIPAHSFAEPTIIKITRNPDNQDLSNTGGLNQFPPAWDYDAIKSSGGTTNADHVLLNGNKAAIVFCLLNSDFVTYPANLRIGHNPVPGAPGFPFEILDEIDLVNDRPDLAAGLNCPNLAPNTVIIGGFGQGLPGLANAAWQSGSRYIGPVAKAIFLPQTLSATTLGTLPPPKGGRAPSLSPFKLVQVSSESGVISNGTISLGVNRPGNLIFHPEGQEEPFVGLRYLATGGEALGHAILNEGWGISHSASEISGYASENFPLPENLTVESFARTSTEATSIVKVGETFRVTHRLRPTTATQNLFEIQVIVDNLTESPLSGVVYRRVMDWDIDPTPFNEFVSIVGTGTNVPAMSATNNGFSSPDPFEPFDNDIGESPAIHADFFNEGPADQGAVFDLALPTIPAGGSTSFVMYYGAAGNSADAKAALVAVGASVVSIARPNSPPLDGTPNTFVFGWSGIGGTPLTISQMDPPVIGAPSFLRGAVPLSGESTVPRKSPNQEWIESHRR